MNFVCTSTFQVQTKIVTCFINFSHQPLLVHILCEGEISRNKTRDKVSQIVFYRQKTRDE